MWNRAARRRRPRSLYERSGSLQVPHELGERRVAALGVGRPKDRGRVNRGDDCLRERRGDRLAALRSQPEAGAEDRLWRVTTATRASAASCMNGWACSSRASSSTRASPRARPFAARLRRASPTARR
jgi:hypothetical protein